MIEESARQKNSGFSLLEVLLALIVTSFVVFLGVRVINVASQNSKNIDEIREIDGGMQTLQDHLKEDLESIILLDKNQTVFEICGHEDRGFAIYFFTSNSENNVTTAVKYDINVIEFGKIKVSRSVLSDSATLLYQQLLTNSVSFEKFFDNIDMASKSKTIFSVMLSDFKIRPAIKAYYDNIVFAPSNVNMRYSGGTLLYDKRGKKSSMAGDLLFFDITMRALTKSDRAKLDHLIAKKKEEAKDFLFSRSRKNFLRVSPISTNMK